MMELDTSSSINDDLRLYLSEDSDDGESLTPSSSAMLMPNLSARPEEKCTECDEKIDSHPSSVLRHLTTQHNVRGCQLCPDWNERSVPDHVDASHLCGQHRNGEDWYKCVRCEFRSSRHQNVSAHGRESHLPASVRRQLRLYRSKEKRRAPRPSTSSRTEMQDSSATEKLKRYSCCFCHNFSSPAPRLLIGHYNQSHPPRSWPQKPVYFALENGFKCPFSNCDFDCRESVNMQKHYLNKHFGSKEDSTPNTHICRYCDCLLWSKEDLETHYKVKHPQHNMTSSEQNKPLAQKQESPTYKCCFCEMSSNSMLVIKQHYQEIHSVRRKYFTKVNIVSPNGFLCPFCPDFFFSACVKMQDHYYSEHLNNTNNGFKKRAVKYSCSFCTFNCNDRTSLGRHYNLKHKTRRNNDVALIPLVSKNGFYCPVCTFHSRYCAATKAHYLAKHSRLLSTKKPQSRKCTIKASSNCNLRCSFCSFGTDYLFSLKQHHTTFHRHSSKEGTQRKKLATAPAFAATAAVFKCPTVCSISFKSCFSRRTREHYNDFHRSSQGRKEHLLASETDKSVEDTEESNNYIEAAKHSLVQKVSSSSTSTISTALYFNQSYAFFCCFCSFSSLLFHKVQEHYLVMHTTPPSQGRPGGEMCLSGFNCIYCAFYSDTATGLKLLETSSSL